MKTKIFNLILFFLVILVLSASKTLFAQNSPQIRGFGETWVGTDGLGRTIPTNTQVGSPRVGKYVGIFYFTWQGTLGAGGGTAIYDNTELIQQNPTNPAYGPRWAFHWWGEPESGYFRPEDPWLIRRNLQMLSDAGVDFLYLDVTNGFTYLNVVDTLCAISEQMRASGIPTPDIVFITKASSGQIVNNLYTQFYLAFPQYSNLWFYWNGKPLIFADITDTTLSNNSKNFFTFRYSWAWTPSNIVPGQWQWIDYYPQNWGFIYNGKTKVIEQIPVSVASHPVNNIGRSFNASQNYGVGTEPQLDKFKMTQTAGEGLYFQQQWNRALQVDPQVVMVTGWNEWIAQRFIAPEDGNPNFLGELSTFAPDSTFFVDNYNEEFSRDIEPMTNGYTDNYYYQLVDNIRRFKGCVPIHVATGMHTIKIGGDFSEWANVQSIYNDPKGDTEHRNFLRYDGNATYINNTGRNDIIESRAAYDSSNIYFYVKTDTALTPCTDKNWMLLFIDSDTNHATGWEGYDYVINLNIKSDSVTTLAKWNGQDSSWVEISDLKYQYIGNQMQIAVPRNLINQTGNNISFYFHWADNIQKLNDITEFFIDGDSAPDRRFNYWYTTQAPTDVKETYQFPKSFSLSQNYPNPFNPSTLIKYSIPQSGLVTIKVFNMLGQEVATLIDKEQKTGSYTINFDASKLASGVYLYRIVANGFSLTKKMLLLK